MMVWNMSCLFKGIIFRSYVDFLGKNLGFFHVFVDSSLPITEVVTWGSPFAGGLDAFEEEF